MLKIMNYILKLYSKIMIDNQRKRMIKPHTLVKIYIDKFILITDAYFYIIFV